MADSRFKKAADILGHVVGPEAMNAAGKYADAFASWTKIAGERFAAHSKVVDIKNGNVVVEADHPGWIQLMQAKQGAMLDALQRSYPELGIRGLMFRLERDRGIPGTRALSGSVGDKAREPEGWGEDEAPDTQVPDATAEGSSGAPEAPVSTMSENPQMRAMFERFSEEVRTEAKKKR